MGPAARASTGPSSPTRASLCRTPSARCPWPMLVRQNGPGLFSASPRVARSRRSQAFVSSVCRPKHQRLPVLHNHGGDAVAGRSARGFRARAGGAERGGGGGGGGRGARQQQAAGAGEDREKRRAGLIDGIAVAMRANPDLREIRARGASVRRPSPISPRAHRGPPALAPASHTSASPRFLTTLLFCGAFVLILSPPTPASPRFGPTHSICSICSRAVVFSLFAAHALTPRRPKLATTS